MKALTYVIYTLCAPMDESQCVTMLTDWVMTEAEAEELRGWLEQTHGLLVTTRHIPTPLPYETLRPKARPVFHDA